MKNAKRIKVAPDIYLYFCNQSKNLSGTILFPQNIHFLDPGQNLDLNLTLPRIKLSRYEGVKVSRYQGIKVSRYQGIKASRYQGIEVNCTLCPSSPSSCPCVTCSSQTSRYPASRQSCDQSKPLIKTDSVITFDGDHPESNKAEFQIGLDKNCLFSAFKLSILDLTWKQPGKVHIGRNSAVAIF